MSIDARNVDELTVNVLLFDRKEQSPLDGPRWRDLPVVESLYARDFRRNDETVGHVEY
ncbi:MAG: hypothetical protein ACOX2M_06955 [Fastidiosipilaceae bacterium]|jgi:hypothetical protein